MTGIPRSMTTNDQISGLFRRSFSIIVSAWNEEITEMLYQSAYEMLLSLGVNQKKIIRKNVPGCYELPLGAQKMVSQKNIDAVICLGCVIKGETPHFDYICKTVAQGILRVSLDAGKPVSFGVITALDNNQALQRAGGSYGNKGEEAALAAIKMLAFDT